MVEPLHKTVHEIYCAESLGQLSWQKYVTRKNKNNFTPPKFLEENLMHFLPTTVQWFVKGKNSTVEKVILCWPTASLHITTSFMNKNSFLLVRAGCACGKAWSRSQIFIHGQIVCKYCAAPRPWYSLMSYVFVITDERITAFEDWVARVLLIQEPLEAFTAPHHCSEIVYAFARYLVAEEEK